jgi:hypothetical protein
MDNILTSEENKVYRCLCGADPPFLSEEELDEHIRKRRDISDFARHGKIQESSSDQ